MMAAAAAAAAEPRKGKPVQATVPPWLVQTEVRSLFVQKTEDSALYAGEPMQMLAARWSELIVVASGICQSAVLLRCMTEEEMMSLV